MLPSELKLASLGHCYCHLPEAFLAKQTSLKPGTIITIRSLQNDIELSVLWNGQLSPASYVQLDFNFAQSNGLKDELIIISLANDIEPVDCSLCRVELVDDSDYNILSQHSDASLLDTCRLVTKDLIVPIYFSKSVQVLVKILYIEPYTRFGFLTKWTELQFQQVSNALPSDAHPKDDNSIPINQPIPIILCAFDKERKLNLGSMLICGEQGSGKTHLLTTILHDHKKFNSELFNCNQLRGKRPENVKKKLNELYSSAIEKQPFILALDDIDSITSSDPKTKMRRDKMLFTKDAWLIFFATFSSN